MPDAQQSLGVAIRNHLQTLLGHQPTLLQLRHQPDTILIAAKGVIDREKHMVEAGVAQDAGQGVDAPVAARRDPQVLVVDLLEGAGARAPPPAERVDARQHERQHFAHVAHDEFEPWEGVEEAAGEEAQDVRRHVRVPAKGRRGDGLGRGDGEVAGVEGGEHGCRWPCRVQVDGYVEVGRRLEHGPVFLAVVVLARRRVVVDQGADEAELTDAALEFCGAGGWVVDGEDREAGEAVWVLLDEVRELVVGRPALTGRHGSGGVRDDL